MKKYQIESYIRNHGLNYDQFAALVGVKRRSVDWWLQRERWVSGGCQGKKVGTGVDPRKWALIQRRTKKEIQIDYLHKISSY